MTRIRRIVSVSDQGLLPFSRNVVGSTEVSLTFGEVERAARLCLGQLVEDSLLVSAAHEPKTVAPTRWGFRALRVAVEPEVSGPRARNGVLAHVHWHPRRFRHLFPSMEADLVARPLSGGRTQLVLEASYRPPGSLLGVVGDVLFGRVVARSTVELFTGRLAQRMEEVAAEGCCGSLSSASTLVGREAS